MLDPRTQPIPSDADNLTRARIFARDWAYGVAQGEWTVDIAFEGNNQNNGASFALIEVYSNDQAYIYLNRKWHHVIPHRQLLVTLGYFRREDQSWNCTLTQKAFDLLDQPLEGNKVFISYKRGEGSALALAIEARLRLVGAQPFVDKVIKGGDHWHAELESQVKGSNAFVCLIGNEALHSEYIRTEIRWAQEAKIPIIPLCFGGMDMNKAGELVAGLAEYHGHQITESVPSAADYEEKINRILNDLGYPTY